VVDGLDRVAKETGRTIPQVAINWLLQRPSVSTVILGARNEDQLRENLGAVGWKLRPEQMTHLNDASTVTAPYPYWPYRSQPGFARLNPPI
jgi:aryl-alcohol dehydrogenase-like predicted oxidoreductase